MGCVFSPLFVVRLVGLVVFLLISCTTHATRAQEANQTSTTVTSSSTTRPEVTRVVQIFFIDEPGYEGLAYTMFHRDSGSVLGLEEDRTTYVITTTRVDQRPRSRPTAQSNTADNNGTNAGATTTTLSQSSRKPDHMFGGDPTGRPSTITQGPATFLYTGTRFGPGRTVINRCSLNGTVSAACNLTHVGDVWYTRNTDWNGTYSTYSYNWTSGDRFGYAPVTITEGAELLVGPATPTASGMPNGGGGTTGRGRDMTGLAAAVVWGMGVTLGFVGFLF